MEVRLDRLVLLVKERQIWHKVLDDVHCKYSSEHRPRIREVPRTMRQRIDLSVLAFRSINPTQTRQGVLPVDIHRT